MSELISESKKSNATRFEELKQVIETSVWRIGEALHAIKSEELYLVSHKSFKCFVEDNYEFSERHAYRLVNHFEVIESLKAGGYRDTTHSGGALTSTSTTNRGFGEVSVAHAELLHPLESKLRVTTWQRAKNLAVELGSRVTETILKRVLPRSEGNPKPKVEAKRKAVVKNLLDQASVLKFNQVSRSKITSTSVYTVARAGGWLSSHDQEENPMNRKCFGVPFLFRFLPFIMTLALYTNAIGESKRRTPMATEECDNQIYSK